LEKTKWKIRKHSTCKSHCSSIEKYTPYKQSKIHGNVHTQHSDQFTTDILNNHVYTKNYWYFVLSQTGAGL